MKERSKHVNANRRPRLLIIVAVAAVVAVTAITVISRQRGRTSAAANPSADKAVASAPRVVVVRSAGHQDFQKDNLAGDKPLTAAEAEKLANGLASMLDTSTDGLTQVKHADGSVSMDLQGRFQNVSVARITADGTIEQSCVDNPRAAAKFFRIDPKLIENAPTARKRTRN